MDIDGDNNIQFYNIKKKFKWALNFLHGQKTN